jgi:hypothetical protein
MPHRLTALALALLLALPACSVDQQVDASARQALAPFKDKFCAMSEPQRLAYLRRRLAIAIQSGGYVAGRHYDTTVVLDSELGAERHEWRKGTGCRARVLNYICWRIRTGTVLSPRDLPILTRFRSE